MRKELITIIGSGPAGLTSAIYAARASLNPLVIQGPTPLGQLTTTTMVENFPGHTQGILGPDLMEKIKEQALSFGARLEPASIEGLSLKDKKIILKLDQKEEITTDALIIASGATPKYLGLSGEKELIGRGISTCATCDGFFYKNQEIYIVGGGDSAIEEGIFLSRFASTVYLIHRRDKFRASHAQEKRLETHPKVKTILNSVVTQYLEENGSLLGIKIKNLLTNEETTHKTRGLFLAIGHNPNVEFLKGLIHLDEGNYIKTENTKTNISGVFACGDVQSPLARQAIVACGTGAQAALMAQAYLEKNALI